MKYKIGIALLCAVLVLCVIFLFGWKKQTDAEQQPYHALAQAVQSHEAEPGNSGEGTGGDVSPVDFSALGEINPDVTGWLSNGDLIDYPVVATQDTSYYLTYDFYGEYNRAGTLFTVGTPGAVLEDANVVIYGHNMGQGREDMFSSLLMYKESAYCGQYPVFWFDTPQGGGTEYRVFAAFQINIHNDAFPYMKPEFADETEFSEFVRAAMDKTPYDCGVAPEYGNNIITLSTCDRSAGRTAGRYIVMAANC